MMRKSKTPVSCSSCSKSPLTKNEVGANKKLLGTDIKQYYCIDCLSAYLEVTPEEIEDKILMFKEEGCTLFQ